MYEQYWPHFTVHPRYSQIKIYFSSFLSLFVRLYVLIQWSDNHGHCHAMHFCPLRCFRDLAGLMRNAGSMAWNPTLKQRLQLQITNQRGVPPLETFTINAHGSSSPNTGVYSNITLQGRSLQDSRHLSEKSSMKSFTARKALLIGNLSKRIMFSKE